MQNNPDPLDADVIVVGAGPTGLLVAAEVALGGGRVIVCERRGAPAMPRAGTLQPRVMEIFASRGLAGMILERAHELHEDPYVRSGIWAGLPGLRYENLDTPFPYVLMFAQIETERLLAERCAELGVDIHRGHEVVGVEENGDRVHVAVDTSRGSFELRCSYLVGADGSHSTVREAVGIPWNGSPADRFAINLDAVIDNPLDDVLTVTNNLAGWALSYPLRDGVTRFGLIDALATSGTAEGIPDLEEARQIIRRIYGTDFGITEGTVSRFHNAQYVAGAMRRGRVFLAGEAVRVHYPASGVGMNFCLQDGFNLGWKLAATVGGWAPSGLLDTYQTERSPQVARLLDDVRRQCAIQFTFTPEMLSLKTMLERDLIPIPDVNSLITTGLAGLDVRYDSPCDHPLAGVRLRDIDVCVDGRKRTLSSQQQDQQFVLLDCSGSSAPEPPAQLSPFLRVLTADSDLAPTLEDAETILIRPDGHVAWVGDAPLAGVWPTDVLDMLIQVS